MARLIHKLSTKENNIPLTKWSFANLFRKKGDEVIKKEWYITARYAGDNTRMRDHEYKLVFNLAEAEELYEVLGEMLPTLRAGLPR
jgi:hypothetical protein